MSKHRLIVLSLGVAACSDGPTQPPAAGDPCDLAPTPMAFHQTQTGTLSAREDCLLEEGRLADDFQLTLDGPTLFAVTLATSGYHPLMPLYSDSAQASGWASATDMTLTREHLFPAGAYVLRSTSFERVDSGPPVTGGYTLSTAILVTPQEGCGRETSVTYGSVATGRLLLSDCETVPTADDPEVRRQDGYDFLLRPGRAVRVTVTADFPYRFDFWANGTPVESFLDVPAGESRRLTAGGIGFLDFYVSPTHPDHEGDYTITFEAVPPA